MRALWRRALDRWSASALPVALALLFPSVCSAATSLLPQDVGTSAATGRSVTDAIGQNENALIDRKCSVRLPPDVALLEVQKGGLAALVAQPLLKWVHIKPVGRGDLVMTASEEETRSQIIPTIRTRCRRLAISS